MISFITSYDGATSDNYNLYRTFNISYTSELVTEKAIKCNLDSEIITNPRNVFVMSHGDHSILYDNNRQSAFTESTLQSLSDFNVFAYACNTANQLGVDAARNGVNWCGFKEPINSPCTDEVLAPIYAELFEFIASEFVSVRCMETAEQYLDMLKNLCDLKASDLDACTNDEYETPIAAYQSVKQLWEKQKIWLSNQNNFVIHKNAPSELLW